MKQTLTPCHIRGEILAIDPAQRSLTIHTLVLNKDFAVDGEAEIITTRQRNAALSDLQVGDHVDVIYEATGPRHLAHRIAQVAVHEHQQAA